MFPLRPYIHFAEKYTIFHNIDTFSHIDTWLQETFNKATQFLVEIIVRKETLLISLTFFYGEVY